jgi:hypothetical protein
MSDGREDAGRAKMDRVPHKMDRVHSHYRFRHSLPPSPHFDESKDALRRRAPHCRTRHCVHLGLRRRPRGRLMEGRKLGEFPLFAKTSSRCSSTKKYILLLFTCTRFLGPPFLSAPSAATTSWWTGPSPGASVVGGRLGQWEAELRLKGRQSHRPRELEQKDGQDTAAVEHDPLLVAVGDMAVETWLAAADLNLHHVAHLVGASKQHTAHHQFALHKHRIGRSKTAQRIPYFALNNTALFVETHKHEHLTTVMHNQKQGQHLSKHDGQWTNHCTKHATCE